MGLAGLGWWISSARFGSSAPGSDARSGAAAVHFRPGESGAGLPKPGSAIEFDLLLAAARRDLSAFTAWLEKHLAALGSEQRIAFLRELMRRWTAEWRAGDSTFQASFRQLAATSPETAGKLVLMLPSVPLRHLLVQELVRSWATRDPAAVERWIETLREADDRSHALTALAEARLFGDPNGAMEWASARLRTTQQPAIVQDLILGFAAADPARAAQWATSLEAGAVRDQATVTLATAWADRDPSKAGQWAVSLPQSAARDDAVTVVGQVWTGTAPDEAIRWFAAQSFTSPDARALAFRDFSSALVDAEPETAERWLGTIADPAAADAALAGAAEAFYDASPERALKTAMRIRDQVARTTAMGDVMHAWREDDPDAAAEAEARLLAKAKKP